MDNSIVTQLEEAINFLCTKFGVNVNLTQIYEKFISWKIAAYISGIIIPIILGVTAELIAVWLWKKHLVYRKWYKGPEYYENGSRIPCQYDEDEDCAFITGFALLTFLTVIAVIVCTVNIVDLIKVLYAPEVAFYEYLMRGK